MSTRYFAAIVRGVCLAAAAIPIGASVAHSGSVITLAQSGDDDPAHPTSRRTTIKSFDYKSDPPRGAVSCGKRVTVRSSARCQGRPAIVIGGCRQSSGARRKVQCQ
jgi:hypothetical protein